MDPQRLPVITHALRTPIGKFLGQFSHLSAVDLGARVVEALTRAAGLKPDEPDQVAFGVARQAGLGPNPGRQMALRGGMSEGVVAYTINMACASGLKTIALAADAVRLGRARIAIAGGAESMTNNPHLLPALRQGVRLGHTQVLDANYQDGFHCPLCDLLMGETAERLAEELDIGREEQDRFAASSQNKCEAARRSGRFEAELIPIAQVDPKTGDPVEIVTDEHPRDGVTAEKLARLPGVFGGRGTVHAGNSSGMTDGAAGVVVMALAEAERRGLEPLSSLGTYVERAVAPERMGIGPVPAIQDLTQATGTTLGDFDLIELNEAFAAQVLACDRQLPLPFDRLNVNGGAIALGHPIGATGARIVVTLVHEMQRRQARRALATLCVSGGMGVALELLA